MDAIRHADSCWSSRELVCNGLLPHTTCRCLFAELWSCCPFKWLVWLPLSPPPSPASLTPCPLAFCQSSQDFRWNGAGTKRARHRLPDMPSQVFVFWGPPPPPPLTPPHHHLPRILENRKYILLSDGWAPCSCWEERKKAFLSLQGSQMSLAVSKPRVDSAFLGAPRSPSAWKPQALLH